MNYKFSCPSCGQHYTATPAHANTQMQCVTCQVEKIVPPPPIDMRPLAEAPAATVIKPPPGHTWDTYVPKTKAPQAGNALTLKPPGEQ
jgi:hypothetical protein